MTDVDNLFKLSIDMTDDNLYTQSAFAKLAGVSRQNISTRIQKGILVLNDDGKLDPEEPNNKHYLEERKINPRKITNPGKNKKPETKKIVNKTAPKKRETKKSSPVKKTPVRKPKPKVTDTTTENSSGEEPLAKQKQRLEVEKLTEQRDKLRRENAVGRAELLNREDFVDNIFSHLSALHKNIMEMPVSFLDDLEAGIKSGLSRSEKMNIITLPICEAITESKDEIKKEIKRLIRQLNT